MASYAMRFGRTQTTPVQNDRQTNVTRRDCLRAAGAVGTGSLGMVGASDTVRAAAEGSHTLVIEGFGTTTSYSFTVGSNLQKSKADGASVNDSDDIMGESAHGAVGGGKDAYTFDGPFYAFDFDRSGEVNVTLDGEPAHVGNRPDHVLVIDGVGPTTPYSFTVGDNLEKSKADNASISSSDDIVRQSAHGAVGDGTDAYTFDGPFYAFDFDRSGAVNVTLDGEPAHVGNRPDHVLAIKGVDGGASYTFAVEENLKKSEAYGASIDSSDEIKGLNAYAAGAVGGGVDSYTFDGRLRSFDFDRSGTIQVLLDGEPAHVGNRPDHVLTINGAGAPYSYEFSVSGSLSEEYGVDESDNIRGSSASGSVGIVGSDSYAYDGEITSFNTDGEGSFNPDGGGEVYRDSVWVDVSDLGDGGQ